jgi:type VI secretion system protein ImpB
VQITYDVETGGAIEKAEIPFVVGIMANLSGFDDEREQDPAKNPVPLKDKNRPFVEIDRDNFTDVMANVAPRLTVAGALDHDGKPAPNGELVFKSLDDFRPDALVARIEELKTWHAERSALRDVLTKLDSNDAFYDQVLAWVMANDKQKFADLKTQASTKVRELKRKPAPAPAQT